MLPARFQEEASGLLHDPEPRRCPACEGFSKPFRLIQRYRYDRCGACGLAFLDREPEGFSTAAIYGDAYFFGGGAGYPDYLREGRILTARGRSYARIVGRFARPGRLLDVGAAAGFIMCGFADEGWSGVGVEPNHTMAAHARSIGLDVRDGAIEAFGTDERFDLVTMIQALAHVRDLSAALARAATLTRPNGLLFCEVMDGGSLLARLLGAQWHGFSPPSVLRIFTPRALDDAVRPYGFGRVTAGRPVKWISARHAKSLLDARAAEGRVSRAAALAARLLPDRLALPYPGRDLLWALYRKRD